jgi:ketosteroid isomerase-like protein
MPTATLNEQDHATQIEQDKSAILTLIEGMKKANHDKQAVAFAAAYTSNAAVYNLAPPLLHRGIDLEEKKAWFNSWEGPVQIESKNFEITVSGDIAFAHGYMRLAGNKKGVEQLISFWMRETLCLERQGGKWKITHEHTSVPFYMDETLRPAFDLQPE